MKKPYDTTARTIPAKCFALERRRAAYGLFEAAVPGNACQFHRDLSCARRQNTARNSRQARLPTPMMTESGEKNAVVRSMGRRYLLLPLLVSFSPWATAAISNQAEEIVRKSVANTKAGWAVAPQYDFTERDVETRHGKRTEKTYQVMMIEGSPYNMLVAVNGSELSDAQAGAEKRKLQEEIERRRSESPNARKKRIAQYQKERRQDHALMTEMVNAFDFKLVREETVNGRRCFVLDATPKPTYQPKNRETQVLKGMRGRMWVDAEAFQWVRVHAEVFRPVTFGLFFASVKPGTEFTLEQRAVSGNLWLPSHFSMKVNARMLVFSRQSRDDETYFNYHRSANIRAGPGSSSGSR
jgi:hypothetical protein